MEIVHSQVGCMDLSELAARFKGRICFEADFNRQQMPRQTPAWIRQEVFRIAEHLGSPAGGLFIVAEVAGATPLANVEAFILDAGETLEMTIVDGKVTAQREKFDYAQRRQAPFTELSGEKIGLQAMERTLQTSDRKRRGLELV